MNSLRLSAALLLFAVLLAPAAGFGEPPPKVDFDRDVRPILSNNCFRCHGPDEKARKAKLRLDTKDGILALDGKELVARITSHEADRLMPPAKSGKTLAAKQVATLKSWIEQGAKWQGTGRSPRRSGPRCRTSKIRASAVRNSIDNFILARLEREGLTPSPRGRPGHAASAA